ncbi:MAG: DMT family transporter, partial [Pseudomonadota bacterium]
DAWVIIFWRGVAAAGFTIGYLLIRGRLGAEWREMGGPGWLVAVISAAGTSAFIPAFKLTTIANVAMIYATAPFLAAVIAWIALRERPKPVVVVASLLAFAGVCLIVGGPSQGGSRTGDLLALFMTLMMAGTMVVYRRWPATPAALPSAIACLLLSPPALIFSAPFAVDLGQMPALAGFGLVFALASVLLSEGSRRLPASETALLSALETPFAPVLAWLVLAEIPATMSLMGGAVILAAVFGAQLVQITGRRR